MQSQSKSPQRSSQKIEKNCKIHMEPQNILDNQTTLSKNNMLEGLPMPDFKE